MLAAVWSLVVGASYLVVDHDVYFYRQVAQHVLQGSSFLATNTYVPPLFGWAWALGGGQLLAGSALAALGSGAVVLSGVRLSRHLSVPPWPVALALAIQASRLRYGAQPLPDSWYLAVHLFVLSELTSPVPRARRLVLGCCLAFWLRFDAFLFVPLYAVFSFLWQRRWQPGLACVAGGLLAIVSLSSLNMIRLESPLPTTRFAVLYSEIGEDQLVNGTTLWHELANEGRLPPEWSPDTRERARKAGVPRESVNADGATWLCNAGVLLTDRLWGSEQLTWILLPLVGLGVWRGDRWIGGVALFAVASVVAYSFLGVRERYLAFSTPLFLILAIRGGVRLNGPLAATIVFAAWGAWQLKVGSYHWRHPEILPLELRQAGEWIRSSSVSGPVLSREGAPAIYAGRRWWRLPTNDRATLMRWVADKRIPWLVVSSRSEPKKRPWQNWLQDPRQVPWELAATFRTEGVDGGVARVYRTSVTSGD